MNTPKLLPLLFFCLCLLSTVLEAQQHKCDTEVRLGQLLQQDPDFAKEFYNQREILDNLVNNPNMQRVPCGTPLIIPVAVHYQTTTIPNQCMIDAAIAQIDQLNLDFSGCNARAGNFCNWINAGCLNFGGTQGADAQPEDGACIQFCLADQNLPSDTRLTTTGYAITTGYNANNQNASNAWQGYLNCYVGNLGGGILGFVNFFGGNNANNTQGVSVLSSTWGAAGFNGCNGIGTNNTFNNGATATHEIGHWFGLDHTFSETPNLADTPPQNQPNYGCPNNNNPVNTNNCSSTFGNDYSGNFMDYVDDDCMFMFSDDQVNIMRNFADRQVDWATNSISCYPNLPYPACNNQAVACNTAIPTCSDGVQNQGETGVDCGGPCPNACPPTCFNNLTNANGLATNETGVADYESSTYINTSSNVTIQSGAKVDYDAKTYVQIDKPFTVNLGAQFNAFIDGCNNGAGGINLKEDGTDTSFRKTINDKEIDLGKQYINALKDKAIEQIERNK